MLCGQKGKKRQSHTLTWTDQTLAAFQDVKTTLANATMLNHPKPEAPLSLMTDASDVD